MIRITRLGLNTWVKTCEDIKKNVLNEEERTPRNLALSFKDMVRQNIQRLGHDKSPGHNTPKSLIGFLKGPKRTATGSYNVFMADYIVANKHISGEYNLPKVVEMGARPHEIFHKSPHGLLPQNHPGFIGRKYWETAIILFQSHENFELGASVKRILKGRGMA